MTRRITPREVKQTIKSFRNGRAPGESGVNKIILENLPNKMILRLTNICNACLATGYFPKRFKKAIIRLIPKAGKSPHRVEGKRPISLLEYPGKIIEKIVNRRLRMHLLDNDLYNDRQHGFRQGRSTQTAISVIYETASNALSDGMQATIVLRDVSKAFDKVWTTGLQFKLIGLNLPECTTKLCCNFLEDRTAQIKLGHYMGETIRLQSGVPQGSCLSPTLYTVYTGDLPAPEQHSEYVAYADDITQVITYPGKSTLMMARYTERAITAINEYERKWKIATNKTKFQVIPLCKNIVAPLNIEGEPVRYDTSGKLLGLKIGKSGLTHHVNDRVNQALAQLAKLRRFRDLPQRQKEYLYKAMIRPILEYPAVPLNTLSKNQTCKLQKIQNAAIRWITGFTPPYTETMEATHTRLRIDPLNVRIHNMAKKTWQRVEAYAENAYARLSTAEPRGNHSWFSRSLNGDDTPQGIYTYQVNRVRNQDPDASDSDPDDPDDP